ncbi:putative aspergillopepsin-2 precursor [Paecilomyces variotii]|uniref:Putative aspergillopepsin-2 n=1 Tax=Byssochlamys spectabilis TaxID=264951 RepID=A0A443HIF9_BYSSP|nr:putative aspergillopepsin-2 precursor [Paecilomyces variotii]KAJ9254430.1 hypothetical protein DTO207G8_3621 [Paecilomyces variotii]KAJ9315875.1 hypothetical protein DTO271D3_3853 [Paecilomyces variotii]KAJ9363685.1 hypothetical protein DTO280E4_2275 [Paecilomyces variotii]KAJ9386379.1 hypothetical protein DTO063F5_3642 [Paecilomyces variotii]RWQ91608.1 putative aspergillopepsin-2 precursor [Paecilomyces variotii]
MASIPVLMTCLLASICIGSPMGHPSLHEMRGPRSLNIPSAYSRIHSNAGIQIEPPIVEGPNTENKNTLTFSNWAGALIQSSDITSVTGTFTVPYPEVPLGGNSSTAYCGCAWVGIDGDGADCPNGGLIQAGASWCIEDGITSFNAWYEWFPAQALTTFDNFDVEAGDEIKVTVTATSNSTGYTILENLTEGTDVRHTWKTESPALCGATAEWIVEDFSLIIGGSESLAPFADYGSVAFTGAHATVNGKKVGVSESQLVNMVQDGKTISKAIVLDDELVVTYKG